MKRSDPSPFMNRIFKSKAFLVFGIIVLIFILVALVRIAKKKYDINHDINDLEAQILALRDENDKLDRLLEYYDTDYFKEKIAREQLGMQKEGEEAISVPTNIDKDSGNDVEIDEDRTNPKTKNLLGNANIYKWWMYLTGNN